MDQSRNDLLCYRRSLWAPLVSLSLCLLWACGEDDPPTLQHYSDEIGAATNALEAAVESHYETIREVTDIEEMHELEQHHIQDALGFMGAMQDAQYGLQTCSRHMRIGMHSGRLAALEDPRQAMHQAMNDMEVELQHHADVIRVEEDIDTGRAEEERHHDAILDLLGVVAGHHQNMLAVMGTMEREGDSMMCSMDTHMHRQW
ncbi:MAG: hypothetical protein OXU20_29555 [Myxococcales bacterium]|nr:hypothetical protein [Myxococcales bacterium]MDD9965243.1 hypothetical protein [Myxococcales bacterium]